MTEKEKIIEAYSGLYQFFDSLGENDIYKKVLLEEFFKYIFENDLSLLSGTEQKESQTHNPF